MEMCGRYASARKRIELLEEFDVQSDRVTESLAPDYNVAPTKPVYAVVTRQPGDRDGSNPDEGTSAQRQLRVVRWGLVPFWAKDIKIGSRLINARAETVAIKPAFRRAFAQRRCLLPADGYYEWQQAEAVLPSGKAEGGPGGLPPGKGRAPKQPMYITRSDGHSLAFAGLYELWRDAAVPPDDADAWLWTATVITTSAPDDLGHIHDRMPMVIPPDSWSEWLDPANNDVGDLQVLLTPAAVSGLTSYPVSTAVNSVRNNGPRLIEPALAPGAAPGTPGDGAL
jgi:putative SOS response-associated peptidase YedK